jgi:uncharacterized membrane protein
MKKLVFFLLAGTLTACGGSQDDNDSSTGMTDAQSGAINVDVALVEEIIDNRCTTCHSATPSDDMFRVAPGNVMFDNFADVQRYAHRIRARSVDSKNMPFMNKTQMTEAERIIIGDWVKAGAPGKQ